MRAGGIVEMGSPQVLYARPAHPFTASFLGEISFISGTAASADGEMVEVLTSGRLLHSLRSKRSVAWKSAVACRRAEQGEPWDEQIPRARGPPQGAAAYPAL